MLPGSLNHSNPHTHGSNAAGDNAFPLPAYITNSYLLQHLQPLYKILLCSLICQEVIILLLP